MVHLRFGESGLARGVLEAFCAWLPTFILVLFALGSVLTIMVYLPLPPDLCHLEQLAVRTPTQASCNTMLALVGRLAPAEKTPQGEFNVTAPGGLHYISTANQLVFFSIVKVKDVAASWPLTIDEWVRRLVEVLFVFSVIWPKIGPLRKISYA